MNFDTFRNSILQRNSNDPTSQLSTSQLLSDQLAREFTTARRYMLAAGAIKDLSSYFYACEEQQRVRAMELIEYARVNEITLRGDYNDQIKKSPIDKSLAVKDFIQELFLQEKQDIKNLETAVSQASTSELIQFLESKRQNQIDRQQEIITFLALALPTLDMSRMELFDSATTTTTTTTSDLASRWNLNNFPRQHIVNNSPLDHHRVDPSFVTATGATTGAIGVATVDPESLPSTEDILDVLPSTEDILDALPIDIDFEAASDLMDTIQDALPSTEDILDALPIDIDFEAASDLMDTIQQNLLDTDTLAQIFDVVSQLG